MNQVVELKKYSWPIFCMQLGRNVLVGFLLICSILITAALSKATGVEISPVLGLAVGVASSIAVAMIVCRKISALDAKIDTPSEFLLPMGMHDAASAIAEELERKQRGETQWTFIGADERQMQFVASFKCTTFMFFIVCWQYSEKTVPVVMTVDLESYGKRETQVSISFEQAEGRNESRSAKESAIQRIMRLNAPRSFKAAA